MPSEPLAAELCQPNDQTAGALVVAVKQVEFVGGAILTPGRLTVALGPNNGGKSKFLRELVAAISQTNAPRLAVQNAEVESRALLDAAHELIARGT